MANKVVKRQKLSETTSVVAGDVNNTPSIDVNDLENESLNAIFKQITSLRRDTSKLKEEAIELSKEIKSEILKFKKRIRQISLKINSRQDKIIETLGVFAALFTFVSSSVQIFSRVQDAVSAGLFIFLILNGLLTFCAFLDYVFTPTGKKLPGTKWDMRLVLMFIFSSLSILIIAILACFAFRLNPVAGTVEFDKAYEDRVKKYITDYATTTLYTKEQVQAVASSTVKARDAELLRCYESTGSLYLCLR